MPVHLQFKPPGSFLKLKQTFSLEIKPISPYNFELSVHKPAGWWWATPGEYFEKGVCWTAIRHRNMLLGLKLQSVGTTQKPQINCTVYSTTKMPQQNKQDIAKTLKRALRVEEDLTDFYAIAAKDPILSSVVRDLYGMHTVGWPELFPALILAITLQMAPMKRSNQMMELLIAHFGDLVDFDVRTMHYWPSPKTIAAASLEELKAKAKLGYRARTLRTIARTLTKCFPTMDELSELEPEEAKKKLLELRGIGEYSAELVMPRMGFPLDVWSAKIFSILFFGKVPEDPRNAIPALKQEAAKRWGNWRGYAFVYILNDLAELSKKVKVDLTQF